MNTTTITLLAWPWNSPRDLPDGVLPTVMAFGLPADAAPGSTLAPDAAAVLHGTDETGPILAICAHHLDPADLFADLVTDLVDGGLTVYVATDPGAGVEGRCELHVPGDAGAGAVVHGRRVSGGEIVVGASDLLGDAECLAEIGDVELAARVRELLAHPAGLPGAARAFARERGDSSPPPPAGAGQIDYARLNGAARVLHDAAHAAGYLAGDRDASRSAASRHADTALFVVGLLIQIAGGASDDAHQRPLLRVARSVLGQTPLLASADTQAAIRLLKDAIAPRGQMADPAALSAVADAAEHGRIVLREISPGIGPLTR